ncbi:MAG: hypothetical protein AABX86_01435 [Nanoarchaeota archaeon]
MRRAQEKHLRNIVVFFLALLVLVGGYFIFRGVREIDDSQFTYHTVDFTTLRENGIKRYQFPIYINNAKTPSYVEIRSDPRQLIDIPYDPAVREALIGKPQVYITMEKNATGLSVAAYVEIKKILGNPSLWQINTTGAFTEAVPNYPVKTCKDTTLTEGVILLQTEKEMRIVQEDACVILSAPTEEELLSVVDKLTLILLNIDR